MLDHHVVKEKKIQWRTLVSCYSFVSFKILAVFVSLSLLFCIIIKCESNHGIGSAIKLQDKRGWSLKTQWRCWSSTVDIGWKDSWVDLITFQVISNQTFYRLFFGNTAQSTFKTSRCMFQISWDCENRERFNFPQPSTHAYPSTHNFTKLGKMWHQLRANWAFVLTKI